MKQVSYFKQSTCIFAKVDAIGTEIRLILVDSTGSTCHWEAPDSTGCGENSSNIIGSLIFAHPIIALCMICRSKKDGQTLFQLVDGFFLLRTLGG